MGEIAYQSKVTIRRHHGPDRSADMPGGETVLFGVHGAVARHYGVSMQDFRPTSTTLDYVVAAAAG